MQRVISDASPRSDYGTRFCDASYRDHITRSRITLRGQSGLVHPNMIMVLEVDDDAYE
jgi:hypothetical protein